MRGASQAAPRARVGITQALRRDPRAAESAVLSLSKSDPCYAWAAHQPNPMSGQIWMSRVAVLGDVESELLSKEKLERPLGANRPWTAPKLSCFRSGAAGLLCRPTSVPPPLSFPLPSACNMGRAGSAAHASISGSCAQALARQRGVAWVFCSCPDEI